MQPSQTASAWPMATARAGRPRDAGRVPDEGAAGQIACIGGTETFGKFVERPWPEILEARLGLPCVNFGIANASVEATLRDTEVMDACERATMTVIEITGAHNMTNRMYSVHPRRNDRFLAASPILTALYPEVDFADFCFTRHLLRELHTLSPERFEVVRAELQQAWSGRMRALIARCGGPVYLMWFAHRAPGPGTLGGLGPDPLFVTAPMMAALCPFISGTIVTVPSDEALIDGELSHRPGRQLGQLAHEEAAACVGRVLEAALVAGTRPASAAS